ncbi:hypothetical protein GCM10023144_40940 [Pigmentiphaga soli]|uniref:UrcA family protein n=2 Tax=Pigmentiphaga soli TaxID=1007095 RepID=A0ABP8HL72_9BURK
MLLSCFLVTAHARAGTSPLRHDAYVKDEPVAPGVFRVTARAGGGESATLAEERLRRRARELCNGEPLAISTPSIASETAGAEMMRVAVATLYTADVACDGR